MKIQMFRGHDIARVIETASKQGHPTLDDIGRMAVDTLEVCAALGHNEEMVEDACKTIDDVLKQRAKTPKR